MAASSSAEPGQQVSEIASTMGSLSCLSVQSSASTVPAKRSMDVDLGGVDGLPAVLPKKLERRKKVKNFLERFSDFAYGLQAESEHTARELESLFRRLLTQESVDRTEQVASLERRCEILEQALKLQNREQSEGRLEASRRVDDIETAFGAWADKTTRELGAVRKQHDSFHKELSSVNSAAEQHRQAVEGLESAVRGLLGTSEQTSQVLADARANLESLHEGVASCEERCRAAERCSDAQGRHLQRVESEQQQRFAEISEGLSSQGLRQEDRNGLVTAQLDAHARCLKSLQDHSDERVQELEKMKKGFESALLELAEQSSQEAKSNREDLDSVMDIISSVQTAWRLPARLHASKVLTEEDVLAVASPVKNGGGSLKKIVSDKLNGEMSQLTPTRAG